MKRERLSTDITRIQFDSMEEWLVNRKGIGGSDASAILGLNPYKTNQELWMEKKGQMYPVDISDKPYVKYGNDAEPLLRALFSLDYPEYTVEYYDNNMEKGKTYFVYGFPSGTIVTFLSETGICEETQITDANNKLTVPDGARTIVLNVAVKYKDVLNYTGTIKICNRESKTYQEQINELSTKIDAMQEIITKIVTAPQRRQ